MFSTMTMGTFMRAIGGMEKDMAEVGQCLEEGKSMDLVAMFMRAIEKTIFGNLQPDTACPAV